MRERGGAKTANKRKTATLIRRMLLEGQINKLPRPNQRQLQAEDTIERLQTLMRARWGYKIAKDTLIRDLKWIKKQRSTT